MIKETGAVKRIFVPIPGSEFEMPINQIVMAIGQGPNPILTNSFPDLKLTKWGNIPTDTDARTNVKGVFAGGDIVTGAATVIEAMGAGKIAARAIDNYLTTDEWPEPEKEK